MHNAYTLIDPSLSVDFIPNSEDEAVAGVYPEGLIVGYSLFKCTESKPWVWRGEGGIVLGGGKRQELA